MVQQATRSETADDAAQGERLEMTYEEFQDWYTEGRRGEWVDGEVIQFVAPNTNHQDIGGFLYALLRLYVEDRDLGQVFQPIEMRLREGRSYREPDLVFVATSSLDRVTKDGLAGPADLVVEIVSDDSVSRDRKEKFSEYADAGVREYWVIDPRPFRQSFFIYVLSDEAVFEQTLPRPDGLVPSTVIPSLSINPAWLWTEPTPQVTEVLPLLLEPS